MVFLTPCLFFRQVFKAPTSRVYKRLQMKRLAAKYTGRSRNCYTIGIRQVNRSLRYSTNALESQDQTMGRLHETRLAAACLEHNMDKTYFMTSLAETDIYLNRETLVNLAIYEPRTFQSLVEFVKERSEETGLQSNILGSHYGADIRGILQKTQSGRICEGEIRRDGSTV